MKETFQSVSHDVNQVSLLEQGFIRRANERKLSQELSISVENVQASLEDLRANQTEYAALQILYHQDMQEQQRISLALSHTANANLANILGTTTSISQSLDGWLKLITLPWLYSRQLALVVAWWGFTFLLWISGMINGFKTLLFGWMPSEFSFPLKRTLLTQRKYSSSLVLWPWTLPEIL